MRALPTAWMHRYGGSTTPDELFHKRLYVRTSNLYVVKVTLKVHRFVQYSRDNWVFPATSCKLLTFQIKATSRNNY